MSGGSGGDGTPGSGEGTRVDLHVKILDETVVDRAKARDLDVLVYAPHFEHIEAIRERAVAPTFRNVPPITIFPSL